MIKFVNCTECRLEVISRDPKKSRGKRFCRKCRVQRWRAARPNPKLSPELVRRVRAAYAACKKLSPVAREFGVSVPTIHRVITGRTWADVR